MYRGYHKCGGGFDLKCMMVEEFATLRSRGILVYVWILFESVLLGAP